MLNIATSRSISIHAPPRGATLIFSSRMVSCSSFQFTPLREGRPDFFIKDGILFIISIHAPPRGATAPAAPTPNGADFNSRPSARGDGKVCPAVLRCFHFNSRPSARGDFFFVNVAGRDAISIHAPPRGATLPYASLENQFADFNSRPSARGDAQSIYLSAPVH